MGIWRDGARVLYGSRQKAGARRVRSLAARAREEKSINIQMPFSRDSCDGMELHLDWCKIILFYIFIFYSCMEIFSLFLYNLDMDVFLSFIRILDSDYHSICINNTHCLLRLF